MLDTATANYSYGNLHTVMKAAITEVLKSKDSLDTALILGFGGGDASQIIHKYNPNTRIVGVEVDPQVIDIYNQYYKKRPVILVQSEVRKFLEHEIALYDLIICDIFVSLEKPTFTQSEMYYKSIKDRLEKDGVFAQNIMLESGSIKDQFVTFKQIFPDARSSKVLEKNYLFFSS